MFTEIVENAAKYLVAESIRDEALGDLWESNYDLIVSGVPRLHRFLFFVWRFLLLIKASVHIYLSENVFGLQSQPSLMTCTFEDDDQISADSLNIDNETTETLKVYCNLRQNYNAKVATRMIGSRNHISELLVRKVEDILEVPNSFVAGNGNHGDFIVSRLKLSLLAKRFKGRSNEGQDPTVIDCEYFRELLEGIKLPKSFLMTYAKFDKANFNRALVFRTRIPSLVSVYVISWEPEQFAPMHHHGNALDGIIVVEGKMTHAQSAPKSDLPHEAVCREDKSEVPSEVYEEGDIVIIPPFYGHQIVNASDERLVTVHFRIGFLPHDEYWNQDQETPCIAWDYFNDKTEVLSAEKVSTELMLLCKYCF